MTGSIRVVSKRAGGVKASAHECVVAVDRTHPQLGNPFILHNHNDPAERDGVISQYNDKYEADKAVNGPMYRAVQKLAERVMAGEHIALECWCAPRKCHADKLAEDIRKLAGLGPEVKIGEQPSLF